MKATYLSALVALLAAPAAFAWPPTFGAEFTFTSPAIQKAQVNGFYVNNEESEAARDRMEAALKARCANGDCVISELKNHYGVKTVRVTYQDGWWFQVATDPAVVEIQTKAATYEELAAKRELIQKDIFDTARSIGITPDYVTGGGHIHIGMSSALDDNALLFRNFFVDYENHSELSSGIFGHDHANAPPIAALTPEQREKFAAALADFDGGKIKTIRDLARRVQKDVYSKTPQGWNPPEKYQAFNITRIAGNDFSADEKTMEIRGIRPQASADDFLLETHLFEKRLARLKSINVPIEFNDGSDGLGEQMKAVRFYEYVHDSGLEWRDYSKWVSNPIYRTVAPHLNCDLKLLPGGAGDP